MGDRGPENGPVYRWYQTRTNGPQTVDGEGPNERFAIRSAFALTGVGRLVSASLRLRVVIGSRPTAGGVGARLFPPPESGPSIRSACWRLVAHDPSMKSRVHPKYKTKYHVGNWP